jgi:hypothetical protein
VPYLLVSDDADQLVGELATIHDLCGRRGRTDIHFLIAARDSDWTAARGDTHAWGGALQRFRMHGLTHEDARSVVRAWQSLGDKGVGKLAFVDGEDARVEALLVAGGDAGADRGSFFGATLRMRFGADGLRAHVQHFMNRLSERDPGRDVLRRGLVATAACDAIGIEGIDRNVLADLLGVPRLDSLAMSYGHSATRPQ